MEIADLHMYVHWQEASQSFHPCGASSLFGKIEIKAPIDTIIIVLVLFWLCLLIPSHIFTAYFLLNIAAWMKVSL